MIATRLVRFAVATLFAVALYMAANPLGSPQHRAYATPSTVYNFGRTCFSVNDFGADPSGKADSTPSFRSAFQAASLMNGVAVCAPAGTYKISGDITLYSANRSGQGGVSFFGAGPGLTVLRDTSASPAPIFDSCPDFSGITPSLATPSACPSAPINDGMHSPLPGAGLIGVTLANFSIDAKPPGGGPPAGAGASGFYFPRVNGLLVDNVCVMGSPTNVFDLGERIANSISGIVIRDSTCQTTFYGHYVALHGGGSGLVVTGNEIRGNQTIPQYGTGLVFDTTDVVGQTISQISWRYNDFEGPFFGHFMFLPAPATGPGTQIKNAEWIGNVYDHCGFACYYFGADAGQSSAPAFSDIRISDRWAISDYDSVYFDGAGYTAAGAGVQGIKISGPSLYGSDNGRKVLLQPTPTPSPQPNGGTFFMLEIQNPGGTAAPSAGIAIEIGGATYSAIVSTGGGGGGELLGTLATTLASNASGSTYISVAGSAPLANLNYALVGFNPASPGLSAGSTPIPYTVVTSGNIRPVNPTATCSLPPVLGMGTPGPCISGEIDIGDGIAFRNGAHDIAVTGARVQSNLGPSIRVWPGGGNSFHFLNNVLGENHGSTSYIGLQIDPATGPSPNPTGYDIEGNDLVGATPVPLPLPTPSFLPNGQPPVMRNNRGTLGVIVGPKALSSTGSLILRNPGPFDCTYYFTFWGGSFSSSTIALPGSSSGATLPTAKPASIFLPVGAVFQATLSSGLGTATYFAFCQP
jgi:hypothetical protein